MTDTNKLRGKIAERGLTQEKLTDMIGMNKATMSRKMRDPNDDFTIKQADKISRALQLTSDEAMAIFFSQFVA